MTRDLETAAREFFAALDRKDLDTLVNSLTDDVEGVDELTRDWVRGRDATVAYFRRGLDHLESISSRLDRFNEGVDGDLGVLTGWLDQDYRYEGEDAHVSSPFTAVFRRESDGWKLRLFHAVPLPPE